MDVVKKHKKRNNKSTLLGGAAAFLIVAGIWFFSGSNEAVERNELVINTVQQGALQVQVEGYGKLRSSKQKLLTSTSNATVEEIILKPGAMVTHDSVIMLLKNPELKHELEAAQRAYNHEQANLRKLKLTQMQELLAVEEKLEQVKSEYETAQMRKQAMEELVKEGIVSKLDYKEVVLSAKQYKKRIAIAQKNIEKLKMVHVESINIQKEAIVDAQSNLASVQLRYDELTVRAGMNGILQKQHVELGQSLTAGQKIALIGGTEDLIALIKVPQAQASQIQVGQKASVGAGKYQIASQVVRVSPTVESGSVEIEIAFDSADSVNLRPEQTVDAVVYIDDIEDAYFIERPANISAFSSSSLYKLSADQLAANATQIEFGVTAGEYIQIKSGAFPGDSLVISDLSYLKNEPTIKLVH
ncbi:HlyD family efflux transporter periplasmic adaptor subunit [Pseudoalteromonas sp. JBTF-M23]|uniref:HlyD family efflux transporter periplasmic adaptor subunit n=1 Tax=Pseudoalteromonas caenipelagi TaxID=2726988 RepID=A0A849VHI0_9GAMM|nr:HlyD family efflux transporter periplasmic adaptor subunit [Pseudoalteromonas caenipelagi]NOU51314.1 HlyD family efflux transporter periplasmic adaptor subunit [Pseudoalteromonas caenipelagi]